MYKRIALDVDSVLLDYEKAFMDKFGLLAPCTPNGLGSLLDGSDYCENDIDEMILTLNSSEEFKNIGPVNGAVHAIESLKSRGIDLVTVSSCGDQTITTEYRTYNLDTVFGEEIFTIKHTLPLGADKTETINMLGCDVLVDDRLFHCENMIRSGKDAIMLDSGYLPDEVSKARELGIPVCQNWNEVLTKLEDIYGLV